MTSDGRLYAPLRFREIVQERYLISKQIHTSYTDLGNITPIERQYLIDFITEDVKKETDMLKKAKEKI